MPEASCLKVSRVEYNKIRKGEIGVKGISQGIPFKNPSSYGKATKLKILQEFRKLQFRGKVVANNKHGKKYSSLNKRDLPNLSKLQLKD